MRVEEIEDGDVTWRFADVEFLRSNWTCIWGRGCLGIHDEPAPHLGDGCCSVGAVLDGVEEAMTISALAATIAEERFQHHAEAAAHGVFADADADAEDRTATRVVDGACIFLNRPGFPGGGGCALHRMALRHDLHPLTTKPDVCWQLPVRREQEHVDRADGTRVLQTTIGEFDRRGWGAGGHDLHWWCTGAPAAHVSPEPLVDTYADELTALIGAPAYRELRRLTELRLDQGLVAPHPASPRPVPVELHRRRPGG